MSPIEIERQQNGIMGIPVYHGFDQLDAEFMNSLGYKLKGIK